MSQGKISIRGVLARSLYKISVKGLLARSLYEISVGAVHKSSPARSLWGPLRKISTDLYAMPLYKISMRGRLASSLYNLPIRGLWQDLFQRSLHNLSISLQELSWQDQISANLDAMSLYIQDLYKMSLGKISVWARYRKSLYELSIRDLLARFL